MTDSPMPVELREAFWKAAAEFKSWRSGPEPTVSFQRREFAISEICHAMMPYEAEPLPPGYLQLLLRLTDDRHSDLKKQLAENYASAGGYLLRLLDDRRDWHRRRERQV